MIPLMPETVRMAAPSNLATSRGLLNMPPMKAVFFRILVGAPVSFSFLTTRGAASRAVTTPVALMRQPCGWELAPSGQQWVTLLTRHGAWSAGLRLEGRKNVQLRARSPYLLVGCSSLDGHNSSVRGRQGRVDVGHTVHMLWSVLQHPASIQSATPDISLKGPRVISTISASSRLAEAEVGTVRRVGERVPLAPVLVLNCIDGDRLEAAPTNGEGEGVPRLQDLGEPPVPLQAQLQVASALLRRGEAPDKQRLHRSEVLHKLTRQPCILQPGLSLCAGCEHLSITPVMKPSVLLLGNNLGFGHAPVSSSHPMLRRCRGHAHAL